MYFNKYINTRIYKRLDPRNMLVSWPIYISFVIKTNDMTFVIYKFHFAPISVPRFHIHNFQFKKTLEFCDV